MCSAGFVRGVCEVGLRGGLWPFLKGPEGVLSFWDQRSHGALSFTAEMMLHGVCQSPRERNANSQEVWRERASQSGLTGIGRFVSRVLVAECGVPADCTIYNRVPTTIAIHPGSRV